MWRLSTKKVNALTLPTTGPYPLLVFSKAFDKVSHEKLVLKLHDYGLRGPALKWVKGFIDNRHQSVIVNGSSSEPTPVSSGVPQGSVLGPLLFLNYINDIPTNVKSKVRLFADDTALYLILPSQHLPNKRFSRKILTTLNAGVINGTCNLTPLNAKSFT